MQVGCLNEFFPRFHDVPEYVRECRKTLSELCRELGRPEITDNGSDSNIINPFNKHML